MSSEDQAHIIKLPKVHVKFTTPNGMRAYFQRTHHVLQRVAQYSQPIWEVQRVWNHLEVLANIQRQLLDMEL